MTTASCYLRYAQCDEGRYAEVVVTNTGVSLARLTATGSGGIDGAQHPFDRSGAIGRSGYFHGVCAAPVNAGVSWQGS